MISVLSEVEKRTKEHPDKLLFAFLDKKGIIKESYTYQSFEERSSIIAAHIHRHYNLLPGDRVLLAYPAGLEMVLSFFACVKLGLIPVPVYPPAAQGLEASVHKLNFIAKDCGARAVLTDRSCQWAYRLHLTRNKSYACELPWIVSEDAEISKNILSPQTQQEILFLQYTSGSTGNPRGVMVSHDNIFQNCNNVVDHLPVGVSWLPQYHDMGLIGYYLFFAMKGGTTYGFSPVDFIQRPALWLEIISRFKASASSAPNFAFELCLSPGKIPENTLTSIDLSSLKFLMTAAEPIKPDVYHSFLKKFQPYGLKPESFFGAYGLAEFTLAVTNYGRKSTLFDSELLNQKIVRLADEKEPSQAIPLMSCGKALGDTSIKIIDTETGNTVTEAGRIGEIWLNGSSKCKGYWTRPELSNEIFNAKTSAQDRKDWLRTGDLGFMHEDELYVCGRIKDMIIIRGLNYYPHDIEAVIEKDPLVRKGCVAAFGCERDGDESVVIIAGLKNPSKIPDAQEMHQQILRITGISVSEIIFVPARTVSKTSSGKIRRNENKEKYLQNALPVTSRFVIPRINGVPYSVTAEQRGQKNYLNKNLSDFQLLLSRYSLSEFDSSALGDAGLDSMRLAEFGQDLEVFLKNKGYEELSGHVDLKLLQKIPVSELYAIMKAVNSSSRHARFKFIRAFQDLRSEYGQVEASLMRKDASQPFKKEIRITGEYRNSENIFMTGGTGFLGPFLLKSLLEQNCDDVYVLVRAGSEPEGMNRLRMAFKTINPSFQDMAAFEKRVKPVLGDLSMPDLGLSENYRNFLCRTIHTVYHNGACVNYMLNYDSMRQINVEGTREVIRLAMIGRPKTLNYVSTTFIFGWSVKDTLYETDSNPQMEFLDFGYSQSKWVCDQLMLKAIKQGLKGRIFRPALIAPSVSGAGHNFDISIRLLTFMLRHGISTTARNQVSFTPADIVANNIVAISNIETSAGKTFHVTRDEYASMREVTDCLGKLYSKTFTHFDLKDFVPEVVNRCTKQDLLFPLLNFLVRSVDNINGMEYKRYDNSDYQKFRRMSAWGKEDPSLDEVARGIFRFMRNNPVISKELNLQSVPELVHTGT